MSSAKKSDSTVRLEEEKLAHALISRGLLSAEDVQALPPAAKGATGSEAFLARLVAAGLLTANQAIDSVVTTCSL